MVLVVVLAISRVPFWTWSSILRVLRESSFFSVMFFWSLAFYVIWGVTLYKAINGRGFRFATISGIWFMCYSVGSRVVFIVYAFIAAWMSPKVTSKRAWEKAKETFAPGKGYYYILLLGLVLLFMGLCFSAQQEVAEKKKRVEKL